MILSDVLLGSQDILDDSSWGPQKRFFGFSFGGYVEGGACLSALIFFSTKGPTFWPHRVISRCGL